MVLQLKMPTKSRHGPAIEDARVTSIPIYQIDAFTGRAFGGNPAAVCPLDDFMSDTLLQSIALENNLSETAFIVSLGGVEADYHLRLVHAGG